MFAGLNAGDEILQLNGKDARTLTFADMKVAFAQVSLSLTVNTLPPVDRRQLCFLPPRRSDAVDNLYTDIFSQSQGEGRSLLTHLIHGFCVLIWALEYLCYLACVKMQHSLLYNINIIKVLLGSPWSEMHKQSPKSFHISSRNVTRFNAVIQKTGMWHHSHVVNCVSTEEILDDGVGLIVETSGDGLDDDSELFAEFDDYGKVNSPILFQDISLDLVQLCPERRDTFPVSAWVSFTLTKSRTAGLRNSELWARRISLQKRFTICHLCCF